MDTFDCHRPSLCRSLPDGKCKMHQSSHFLVSFEFFGVRTGGCFCGNKTCFRHDGNAVEVGCLLASFIPLALVATRLMFTFFSVNTTRSANFLSQRNIWLWTWQQYGLVRFSCSPFTVSSKQDFVPVYPANDEERTHSMDI